MNRIYLTVYIAGSLILLVSNGILLFRQKGLYDTINTINEFYYLSEHRYKTISNDIMTYSYMDDMDINPRTIVRSERGDSVLLKDLVHKTSFVVKYSYLNCEECINYQINVMKTYIDKIGIDNILILVSYANLRSLSIDKKLYDYKKNIFYFEDEGFDFTIENKNEPYFFILDDKMKAKHFFIPRKEMENLTNDYMKMICNKFFVAIQPQATMQ
jgi:hypothetical protein